MHTNVLPGATATGLRKIAATRLLDRAYLAGGTAAALQLGHRISRDLDFFTDEPFEEMTVAPRLEEEGLRDLELDIACGTAHGDSFLHPSKIRRSSRDNFLGISTLTVT
ncbi:MAG: hypothetical protein Greene041619_1137 [Candidatus Peregrinibacteria bacterium Greene0416_19]|nr:MAG: hypothetical protein Greene041619_1137 [Candidatus Peregrinibacteria bacterium Greene0416_19]